MKVTIPLGLLLMVAIALGYLLGTESGRQQRDSLIRVIRREEAIEAVEDAVAEAVDEAVAEAATTED